MRLRMSFFCSTISDSALVKTNSPEITFAKFCKLQKKMHFICIFEFFVVILRRILRDYARALELMFA